MKAQISAPEMRGREGYDLAYIWLICAAAALGGLLFGYDWVVIGGAKPFYELFFGLNSPALVGAAMSSALVGCLIGAIASCVLSDRYGRKRLLILAAALFIATSVGTATANSFTAFLVWRVCGGVAIGLASNVSPMYIAEVAPAFLRGRLVSLNQMTIVLGIVVAQATNWIIARPVPAGATAFAILHSWNGQTGWRWMFGSTAIPAFIFLVCIFAVPESPRWLAKNGDADAAAELLVRIAGPANAKWELEEIEATLLNETARVDFRELLEPKMLRILALGVFLAIFQQWCGINVVFNYAQEVFGAAGYQVSDILFNIVITGATLFVFTLFAILTVDRVGRRPLMLAGSAGLVLSYFALGSAYHFGLRGWPVLAAIVVAISCYAFSLAPITWVLLSEIFPNRIRGAAVSLAVFSLWSGCLLLTYTFPFLNRALGSSGTFWVYCGVCIVGFLVIFRKLPETKGKTLEQIERELVD